MADKHHHRIFNREECENYATPTNDLTKMINSIQQDVNVHPNSSLHNIVPFLAYLKSLNLPLVPPSPPQLPTFDLNLCQKFHEVSQDYQRNLTIEQNEQEQAVVKQKSSTQILESLPELLKMQTASPISNELVNKIMDKLLVTLSQPSGSK